MNPWLLYGGLGVAAYLVYSMFAGGSSAAPASDGGDGSSVTTPYGLPLASGFGTAAGGDPQLGGQSIGGSALSALASALSLKSNNDLQLGLAQTDVMKSLGLGALSNAYMHDVFANMPLMAKAGISRIGGMIGGTSQSATLTYSDPDKNVSLATGYNAQGDLIGPDGQIIKQSTQSDYTSHTYTDIHGKLHNKLDPGKKKKTPTPPPPTHHGPGPGMPPGWPWGGMFG